MMDGIQGQTQRWLGLTVGLLVVLALSACGDAATTPGAAATAVTATRQPVFTPTAAPTTAQSVVPGVATMKQATNAINQGDTAQATRLFKQSLSENPNLAEAHCSLGLIYSQELPMSPAEHELRQGIAIFEKTQKSVVPNVNFKQALSICYAYLGYVLAEEASMTMNFNSTNYREAEQDYQRAVELDPTNNQAQEGLATVRMVNRVVRSAP